MRSLSSVKLQRALGNNLQFNHTYNGPSDADLSFPGQTLGETNNNQHISYSRRRL